MGSPAPSDRKKVLVVSASVGAGHNQAARAIVAGLSRAAPHVHAEWVDLLPHSTWLFRSYYAGGYGLIVSRLPWGYGIGYRLTDRPDTPRRSLEERRRLLTEAWAMRGFLRWVVRQDADLIVNTHFLAPPLLGRMIAKGRLAAPQMVVVTDTYAHRYWYSEHVQRYFLSAPTSHDRLRRWGIAPDRITVSGMPVHPKWLADVDAARVRREWRLPAEGPLVVLSGGADFTCGPIVAIARRVLDRCGDAVVVVLAGRNKNLLGHLARREQTGRKLFGVSFTDRVQELVGAADLMITKAGGATTAECLARGTPMILLKPVPGQEAYNAAYYRDHGAAVLARGPRHAAAETARLLADRDALARMAAAARALYLPATETIVDAVLQALGETGPGSP